MIPAVILENSSKTADQCEHTVEYCIYAMHSLINNYNLHAVCIADVSSELTHCSSTIVK